MSNPLKILFKYPSRGRKGRFIDGMNSIINNLQDTENFHILVTADSDDKEMEELPTFPNTTVIYGESNSKIHAINRDLDSFNKHWDIILCMSDDMRFTFWGFDTIIRERFSDGNLDRLIHIPDNDAKFALQTMYIAGRTYFDRFGWIYNPVYFSLFCDNEAHEIGVMLGKYEFVNCNGIICHLNPAYGHLEKDALFESQQIVGWSKDQVTYHERKARNFDIHLIQNT